MKRVRFEGREYSFPDDATDEEIRAALEASAGAGPGARSAAPAADAGAAANPPPATRNSEQSGAPASDRVQQARYRQHLENSELNPRGFLEQTVESMPFARDIGALTDAAMLPLYRMSQTAKGRDTSELPADENFLARYRGFKRAADDRYEDFATERPAQNFAAAVAAPAPAVEALAGLRLIPRLAEEAPAAARGVNNLANLMATGALTGAAFGATTGRGDLASGEGLQERLDSTAEGAKFGAAAGPLFEGGAWLAGHTLGPLARGLSETVFGDGQGAARRKLAELMAEGNMSPERAMQTFEAGASRGKPMAVIDAVGDAGPEAAAGLIHAGGEARQTVQKFLQDRDAGRAAPPVDEILTGPERAGRHADLVTQLAALDERVRDLNKYGKFQMSAEELKAELARLAGERQRLNLAIAGKGERPALGQDVHEWSLLREGGSADRIAKDLKETLSRNGIYETKKQVSDHKQQQAAFHYVQFDQEPPMHAANFPELAQIFWEHMPQAPGFRDAVKRAVKSAENRMNGPLRHELWSVENSLKMLGDDQHSASELGEHFAQTNSLRPESLLQIKFALDEIVQEAHRKWMTDRAPLDAGKLGDLIKVQNEFKEFLYQAYPKTFPKANETFAGLSSFEAAYDRGRELREMTLEDVRDFMSRASGGERELFELGARDALIDVVKKTPDGANEVRRIFGTPDMRDKLTEVFRGGQRVGEFSDRLSVENLMFAPTARALRNSTTAANFAAAERYAGAGAPTSAPGLVSRLASAIAKPVARGIDQRNAKALARLLVETDGAKAREILTRAGDKKKPRKSAAALAAAVAATMGSNSNSMGAR